MQSIHYNPVKHGLVSAPVEWKYRSFHEVARQGMVPADWGAGYGLDQGIGMEQVLGWWAKTNRSLHEHQAYQPNLRLSRELNDANESYNANNT